MGHLGGMWSASGRHVEASGGIWKHLKRLRGTWDSSGNLEVSGMHLGEPVLPPSRLPPFWTHCGPHLARHLAEFTCDAHVGLCVPAVRLQACAMARESEVEMGSCHDEGGGGWSAVKVVNTVMVIVPIVEALVAATPKLCQVISYCCRRGAGPRPKESTSNQKESTSNQKNKQTQSPVTYTRPVGTSTGRFKPLQDMVFCFLAYFLTTWP